MNDESLHLHELAEVIGPRPAATDAEARAADYIERVFRARGLETERQEFVTPRTYAWSMVIYNVLTVAAAVAIWLPILRWPAFAVALLSAVFMWLELDTRWGLVDLMPKGPSQNVIARHLPKARRGERTRKIVIVAHYDSARSSLAFSPSMVKNFGLTFGFMKAITFAMPVLVLASALPFTDVAQPWLWYATMAVSAYLLVPIFINIHRELFMRHVDGANDNASGVAVMLGVLARIVPEPEDYEAPSAARPEPASMAGRDDGGAATDFDLFGDEVSAPASWPAAGPAPEEFAELPGPDDFGTDLDWSGGATPVEEQSSWDLGETTLDLGPPVSSEPPAPAPAEPGPADMGTEKSSVSDWLGVGSGFDARKKGREIGSWDDFTEDDDDAGGLGWKGGAPPFDDIDDPDFAATEASRIRRRVTERQDREVVEKEVWFVATGAEEVGTRGMRAFIAEYSEELDDALIVNIDGVGAGSVYWVTSEGMARRYHSDRRLVSAARRAASEHGLPVRARDYKGLSTDATPALARGYRAMSVMAFDINGRIPNWHWKTDTAENISVEAMETATEFVTRLIGQF